LGTGAETAPLQGWFDSSINSNLQSPKKVEGATKKRRQRDAVSAMCQCLPRPAPPPLECPPPPEDEPKEREEWEEEREDLEEPEER